MGMSTAKAGSRGGRGGVAVRYCVRYLLLMIAAALLSYGLIGWHDRQFDLFGFLLYDNGWRLHPLHCAVVGIGMIPPAIWDLFQLEAGRAAARRQFGGGAGDDA